MPACNTCVYVDIVIFIRICRYSDIMPAWDKNMESQAITCDNGTSCIKEEFSEWNQKMQDQPWRVTQAEGFLLAILFLSKLRKGLPQEIEAGVVCAFEEYAEWQQLAEKLAATDIFANTMQPMCAFLVEPEMKALQLFEELKNALGKRENKYLE